MSEQYVTAEEICAKRSPVEFVAWIEAKFDEIARKPGGKDAIRFRKGLCKVLVEEVYALASWLHIFFRGTIPSCLNQYWEIRTTTHWLQISQVHPQ
jgi:hypothetical protein